MKQKLFLIKVINKSKKNTIDNINPRFLGIDKTIKLKIVKIAWYTFMVKKHIKTFFLIVSTKLSNFTII